MRDELLNETLFTDLAHARQAIEAWVADYNTARPHSALGYRLISTAHRNRPSRCAQMKAPRAGQLPTSRRRA
jgi:transposase InsO family protein